jgi:hypothetical protein
MTQAAQGYGMGKFGGVKLAREKRSNRLLNALSNMLDIGAPAAHDLITQTKKIPRYVSKNIGTAADPKMVQQLAEETIEQTKHLRPGAATGWRRAMQVGAPLAIGAAGLELMEPISEVFSPVAQAAGERLSEGMGLSPDPMQQTLQKGIDALAQQGAKEIASGLAIGAGAGMRAGLGALRRPARFETMLQTDPVLMQAPPEQMPLLQQSYQALQRVAPRLSQEPFVVKNYLRDIMVTNQGPDHATLSSLARSEQTISEARG